MIEISAKNVEGIGELEDTLKEMFFQGELTFNDEIYITNVRQKTALQDAYAALERVNDSIDRRYAGGFLFDRSYGCI